MGLLEKLQTQGSNLSENDGQTPKQTKTEVPLNNKTLLESTLDLDGKTPKKYLDNLPK